MIEAAGADVLRRPDLHHVRRAAADRTGQDRQEGADFVEAYKKKFGKLPDEAYAVYGYECAKVVLEAIRKAGVKNRDAITVRLPGPRRTSTGPSASGRSTRTATPT